jgi:hypothetical protein
MPLATYRFVFDQPGLHPDQLIDDVGDPLTIVTEVAGGLIVDVQADVASQQDVIDTMESKGFTFLTVNPSTSVEQQFKDDNNLDGGGTGTGLEFAIFKIDGGLVYDSQGHPQVKLVS